MVALPAKTVIFGNPQSATHLISPSDLAEWMDKQEKLTATGGISYVNSSLDLLNARAGVADGEYAVVINSEDEAGTYERIGGAWVKVAESVFYDEQFALRAEAAAELAEAAAELADSEGNASAALTARQGAEAAQLAAENAADAAAVAQQASESASAGAATAETGALQAQTAAEAARDAAVIGSATVYPDTAAGLAGTTVGQYFTVPSSAADEYVILYRHDSGPVATIIKVYFLADVLADSVTDVVTRSTGALVQTRNLFDKDDPDYTQDKFVSSSSGTLQTSTNYDASGYIRVTAGLSYYLSSPYYLAWYDSNKTFISGVSNPASVVVAPTGAAFLRTSLRTADGVSPETYYVTQGTVRLGTYEPFGGWINPDRIRDIGEDAILKAAVTPPKTSFLILGKNLFDPNSDGITDDYQLSASGSAQPNTDYFISDFIEVEPSTQYVCNSEIGSQNMRFLTAFDDELRVVSAYGSNSALSTFTTPASGVKYVRFTGWQSTRSSYQFEVGAASTTFEPFAYTLSEDILLPASSIGGASSYAGAQWAGALWTSYGDSITFQEEWQGFVADALTLTHTALGVGGRTISGTSGMNIQANVDTIATDQELLTVMGGTNDWAQDYPLGTPDSVDVSTFYGALNVMYERLQTRLPTCRIVAMTPPYGELIDLSSRPTWADGATNAHGLTIRDYAEAVRDAAKRWGIPVADVNADEGVNPVNLDLYRKDDGGRLHPNIVGGQRVASVICGKLRSIDPIS